LTGFGERLEPAQRVGEIDDALKKILRAGGQREWKRQAARGGHRGAYALDGLRERIDRVIAAPGRVLDRSAGKTRLRGEADRLRARLRIVAETILEIRADRQRRRLDDRAHVRECLVAIDGAFRIGPAEREGEPRTGRRERLEAKRREHPGRPRVPWVRNREDSRPCVQRAKRLGAREL
jgi:hypothetical protein